MRHQSILVCALWGAGVSKVDISYRLYGRSGTKVVLHDTVLGGPTSRTLEGLAMTHRTCSKVEARGEIPQSRLDAAHPNQQSHLDY